MDNKNKFLVGGIILVVLLSVSSVVMSYLAFKERNKPHEVIIRNEEPDYKVFTPSVPDEMYFCGEEVPLDDFDVKARIEREILVNSYWHSATILNLKRANRWFPIIEPILKQNGIPDDFKYMAVIESGLSNVVSPAGAAGFWQLMEPAAKKHGLEVNSEVDERFNVTKATGAACDYLKEAFAKYGSWTLSAASYNYGLNGIDRQIGRQKTGNYYNLYLNEETYRFIARILAIKEIFQNPKAFGFDLDEESLYPRIKTREISVNSRIKDLAEFASDNGINYKILKILNPWLRDNKLTNPKKKKYVILIPVNDELFKINE